MRFGVRCEDFFVEEQHVNTASSILLTHRFIVPILGEFRRAMRRLLFDLCEEFEQEHRRSTTRFRLPLPFFRMVGNALHPKAFSHWKVVGWIEDVNDLLFFVDVFEQTSRERQGRVSQEFIEQVFSHCEQQFYEHNYLDDLFPTGTPQGKGFTSRLTMLCSRLAQQVTQESLLLVEGLFGDWMSTQQFSCTPFPLQLYPNFERGEEGGCLYMGINGGFLQPPLVLRKKLEKGLINAWIGSSKGELKICIGRRSFPISSKKEELAKGWLYHPPCWVRDPKMKESTGLTLGPTLIYDTNEVPRRLVRTDLAVAHRIRRALVRLDQVWPEGATLVSTLTSRIIPLQAPGVVSFSYRNRPGLSFINVFERNHLDLIDDLVHENSHHHLNLLLRKYQFYKNDQNQEIFYSPWRRSLRPLRGILHATFTFSMGAMLFAKMASHGFVRKKRNGTDIPQSSLKLSQRDVRRAVARGLEEVASVSYSFKDLKGVAVHKGWLTSSGQSLVRSLGRVNAQAGRMLTPLESTLKGTRHRIELLHHSQALNHAAGHFQILGNQKRRKEMT